MSHVWIIELNFGKRWKPTVGIRLTLAEAKLHLEKWKDDMPDERLRIRKYIKA